MKTDYHHRVTPERITALKDGEVFVFGSNLNGWHGGGAARAARLHFGAEWGKGKARKDGATPSPPCKAAWRP